MPLLGNFIFEIVIDNLYSPSPHSPSLTGAQHKLCWKGCSLPHEDVGGLALSLTVSRPAIGSSDQLPLRTLRKPHGGDTKSPGEEGPLEKGKEKDTKGDSL